MTTISLEINRDSYLLVHLTYDPENKVYTKMKETDDDWRKVNFKCPEESEHYSFFKSLYFHPPPENKKCINKIFE